MHDYKNNQSNTAKRIVFTAIQTEYEQFVKKLSEHSYFYAIELLIFLFISLLLSLDLCVNLLK